MNWFRLFPDSQLLRRPKEIFMTLKFRLASLAAIILAVTSIVVCGAQDAATPPHISRYFGSWVIRSFEHPRMSTGLTDQYAKTQMGKSMRLSDKSVEFDKGFLWLSGIKCTSPKYSWLKDDNFVGHLHQALLPEDHPKKQPGDLLFISVDCSSSSAGFEVDRTGELVAYYDGYYFFLRRVKK